MLNIIENAHIYSYPLISIIQPASSRVGYFADGRGLCDFVLQNQNINLSLFA